MRYIFTQLHTSSGKIKIRGAFPGLQPISAAMHCQYNKSEKSHQKLHRGKTLFRKTPEKLGRGEGCNDGNGQVKVSSHILSLLEKATFFVHCVRTSYSQPHSCPTRLDRANFKIIFHTYNYVKRTRPTSG